MTAPIRVGEALPQVLAEVIDRAGPGYDRWAEQVAATGYCHHPVRLHGKVRHADRQTGEVRTVYDTASEPNATLLKACGNRRASVCPSCSAVYQADQYQLLAAGLRGGKGIPATVTGHPRLFVTFTAPSFGNVHTRKAVGRYVYPCHPHRQGDRCPHGRRAGCWHRHDPDDPRLGEPLCPACYQSGAQVLWNALAGRLWSRTTIYLYRALAHEAGLSEATVRSLVRVSFAKVAEYQRRGAIHVHAIIRLDATTDDPDTIAPPPAGFTAALLEAAIRRAAATVAVAWPLSDDPATPGVVARWGAELDVRHLGADRPGSDRPSEEQVAGYVAKYATKSTEALGVVLDHRVTDVEELHELGVPAHVAELVGACLELAARPALTKLRLGRWAHMLGFGGHFATKSRRYSTTLGALRRARTEYAIRRRRGDAIPLDAWGRPAADQAVIVVASWQYAGRGYLTTGEAWLAACSADRARQARRLACEELRSRATAV